MSGAHIVISQPVLSEILAHAAQCWPRECCGLLIAAPAKQQGAAPPRYIARAVAAQNVARNPETTFEIDPALLLQTHRYVRDHGEEIIGCYHSHPDGTILPSRTDLARAEDPGFYWLIVGSNVDHCDDWAIYQRQPVTHDLAHQRFFARSDCAIQS
ncbi:Mov34/MPN/PAD-1 family protein [Thalassospira mesophila]|uniref:Mov34/MPN/PAD-1 family protein n=1 Tax=Thalassospira mesophila TaxID=1293891 RepID=UPI000A1EEA6B|nr:M67 family metallopeptidase [Thalassospira mesophila]